MDNNPGTETPNIQIGSKAHETVICAQCNKQLPGKDTYTYRDSKKNTLHLCETCRNEVEKTLQMETANPNIIMAAILGGLAAIVAGIVWFYFVILTGYQVGYIAIGVGFLIGWAVVFGSGKKRGPILQIMSGAITFLTLFCAEYFMMLHYYRQALLQDQVNFPGYNGEFFWISPFNPDLMRDMFSPMGLVIWGIGIYFAYMIPKSRTIASA